MYTDGQRIERHEVERWVAAAFPFPFFRATVTEKEEPQHNRVRVTTTITGPGGEPITDLALNRKAVYFSMRPMSGMVQFSEDWTA